MNSPKPSRPGTLNATDIQYLGPNLSDVRAQSVAQSAEKVFETFGGLEARIQRAHFLAQVAHETGGFRWMKELGNADYLSHYQQGDRNYCGRGWIMTTWDYNYRAVADYLGIDCVNHPEMLQRAPFAALSAGVFWQANRCGEAAMADNIEEVTRRINGGLTHISERLGYLTKAKEIYGILPEATDGRRDAGGRIRHLAAARGGHGFSGRRRNDSWAASRTGADPGTRFGTAA